MRFNYAVSRRLFNVLGTPLILLGPYWTVPVLCQLLIYPFYTWPSPVWGPNLVISLWKIYGWGNLFWIPAIGIYFACFLYELRLHRPIEISNQGLAAIFWWRTWRAMQWPEVRHIERLRLHEDYEAGRIRIKVEGAQTSIVIMNTIQEFDRLIELLNKKIEENAIPVFSVNERPWLNSLTSADGAPTRTPIARL